MTLTKSDEALVENIAFRVGEIIAARLSAGPDGVGVMGRLV